MKYKIIQSKDGRKGWDDVGGIGTWEEVWQHHNHLKQANPNYSFFIISAW